MTSKLKLTYDQYHVLFAAGSEECVTISTSQYYPPYLSSDGHCTSAGIQGLAKRGLIEYDGFWRAANVSITDAGIKFLAAYEQQQQEEYEQQQQEYEQKEYEQQQP